MMQYVTVENCVVAVGAAGWVAAAVVAGLRWVAPRTATTIDDRLLDTISTLERAKMWAVTYAPYLWQALEWAQKQGTLPTGTTKGAEFLLKIRDAYRAQHGADLPASAETAAQVVAAAMSVGAKAAPVPVGNPSDPRPAPVAVLK
jgi:hypothetical protein